MTEDLESDAESAVDDEEETDDAPEPTVQVGTKKLAPITGLVLVFKSARCCAAYGFRVYP